MRPSPRAHRLAPIASRPSPRAHRLAPIASRLSNSLFLILALLFPCRAAPAPAAVPWDSGSQGGFVTALCQDRRGRVWAASESEGVWEFSPTASAGHQWAQFTAQSTGGLGGDDVYSLACDRLGRVWAGTGRDGVSVYNGRSWKCYDRLTGPLGCHVVALTTSPLTGDVWGCTEAGLFSYSLHGNTWRYWTRADGLPSDQTDCLAFAKDGTLYVGTDCDGLAIASPSDSYQTWRHVPGPVTMPDTPGGDGLPSGLINCLLVARDGTVYAGTDDGLAHSQDGGHAWRFLRGADWKDKLAGLYNPLPPQDAATSGLLLSEGYVTALAEDGAGHLFLGHRQKGLGVYDERTAQGVATPGAYGGYIKALLPTAQGHLLIGTYGDGLTATVCARTPAAVGSKPPPASPPLPAPAAPPTAAQLAAMLRRVRSLAAPLPDAAYLGEDWQTQGDWVGRYGRQYARLAAMQAPWGDHVPFNSFPYAAVPALGPQHDPHDALRSWISWLTTDTPRSLYDPLLGGRRQAEWDDHGETYPMTTQGPGLLVHVRLETGGLYRLSLYVVNKDGGPGGGADNRFRDYLVDVLPYQGAGNDAPDVTPLARARVRDFWGGVYERFLLRGPGEYSVRVAKNGSLNTLCSGVFLDRLTGPLGPFEDMGGPYLGAVRYDPPAAPAVARPAVPAVKAAQALWGALDAGWGQSGAEAYEGPYRLLCYRAALAGGAPAALLAGWRWRMPLWGGADRTGFGAAMASAFQSYQAHSPAAHVAGR